MSKTLPLVSIDEWTFIRTIGKGLFGKVKLAKHKKRGTYKAIKVMEKKQIIEVNQIEHIHWEYKLLKELEHPFIVLIIVNLGKLKRFHTRHQLALFIPRVYPWWRFIHTH
jgi:serine/threonine protein kinase